MSDQVTTDKVAKAVEAAKAAQAAATKLAADNATQAIAKAEAEAKAEAAAEAATAAAVAKRTEAHTAEAAATVAATAKRVIRDAPALLMAHIDALAAASEASDSLGETTVLGFKIHDLQEQLKLAYSRGELYQ